MNVEIAKQIILHGTQTTESYWKGSLSWADIDETFIRHGYEQGGFNCFKFFPLLKQRNISTIGKLGSILDSYEGNKQYDRNYAGSLFSEFYVELRTGRYGVIGNLFHECISIFLGEKLGKPGRFLWRMLWQLLICCNFLKKQYDASFATYLKKKYAAYKRIEGITDLEFLNISKTEWQRFLSSDKPWSELYGIGENVFDYIVGDIAEATFIEDSFKLDSANKRFLTATGISKLINPFDRENTIRFLNSLTLPFRIRDINKGIYFYCSGTEKAKFGFCMNRSRCQNCKVFSICEKNL